MLPNIDLEVYPMKTQKSFFEQNGGTYMQVGDVLLPYLSIGEVEQRPIGKLDVCSHQMACVSSARRMKMILRRSASTCWRCWPSSEMKV